MVDSKSHDRWEDIYKNKGPGNFLRYPNEVLVSLFFRYRSQINQQGKALDYGFGSGNNAELLIQHMAELYGVEISESAVQAIGPRLQHYANFRQDNFATAFKAGFEAFDLVLAWQVLCYNTKDTFAEAVATLASKVRPGGLVITSLTAQDDMKAVHAEKIGEDTFRIGREIAHQEGCVIYAPATVDGLADPFRQQGLEIIDSGYFQHVSLMSDTKLSEFYVVAKKA
jgi:SAM-dependent methyltransferase